MKNNTLSFFFNVWCLDFCTKLMQIVLKIYIASRPIESKSLAIRPDNSVFY